MVEFKTVKEKAHVLAYLTTDIIIYLLLGYGVIILFPILTIKLVLTNIICLLILKTIIVNELNFSIGNESVKIKYLFKTVNINMNDIIDVSVIKYDDLNKKQKYNEYRTNSDKLICIKHQKRKSFTNKYKEQLTLISPNSPELFLRKFNEIKEKK